MRFRLLLIVVLVAIGCDSGVFLEAPSAECAEAGVQCVLPDGPLGVCERWRCDGDETSPCFRCTPQH